MYLSPIEEIYKDMQMQIVEDHEKQIMKAVREVGIKVDKDELVRALRYDRDQYNKGYQDAKNDYEKKVYELIKDIDEGYLPLFFSRHVKDVLIQSIKERFNINKERV